METMSTKFNISGTIESPQGAKLKSPFKEVRQAVDFLEMLLKLTEVKYDNLRLEELETPQILGMEGKYRISLSYIIAGDTESEYIACPRRIRKTIVIEDGEITSLQSGSLAEQED